MSKPLLYVTFNEFPQLGRLKIVDSKKYRTGFTCNSHCALAFVNCSEIGYRCIAYKIHYERDDERQAKAG